MRAPGDRLLAVGVAVPFLLGASVGGDEGPAGEVVARFGDPAIVESSGLVSTGGLLVTVNDSGDAGRTYVTDAGGATVGHADWGDAVDVEALAPLDDDVLVGDIGDNAGVRESVSLLRVPVGRGDVDVDPASAVPLVYPTGPQDAESLLVDPVGGAVLIASKTFLGGTLYRVPDAAVPPRVGAPAPVEPVRLVPLARVPGLLTDGAFFPDGRHLVLRGYDQATVYSWPALEQVGTVDLPDQQQGESIAVDEVDGDFRVLVGSEGTDSEVLAVRLPGLLAEAVAPQAAGAGAGGAGEPGAPEVLPGDGAQVVDGDQAVPSRPAFPFLLGGGLMVVALVVLLRSLRPR